MRVALVQLDIVWECQEDNYAKVENILSEMSGDADLVVLPELFSTGVTLNPSSFVEELGGRTCIFLSEQAKLNKFFLVGGFIEKNPVGLPFNSLVVYNSIGELVCHYRKNNVFSFGGEDKVYSRGDSISFFKVGDFTIVPLVCYDLRFPELFRGVLGCGVNLFVVTANWSNPRSEHWITLLKARAIENQCFVVGVNRVGISPCNSFFGNSMVVSPKGEVVSCCDDSQEWVVVSLDADDVQRWRDEFPALRDRRMV